MARRREIELHPTLMAWARGYKSVSEARVWLDVFAHAAAWANHDTTEGRRIIHTLEELEEWIELLAATFPRSFRHLGTRNEPYVKTFDKRRVDAILNEVDYWCVEERERLQLETDDDDVYEFDDAATTPGAAVHDALWKLLNHMRELAELQACDTPHTPAPPPPDGGRSCPRADGRRTGRTRRAANDA